MTEDSEGEPGEGNRGNLEEARAPLRIGDRVEAHGQGWERIEDLTVDGRTEPVEASKFKRLHYNESMYERGRHFFAVDATVERRPVTDCARGGSKCEG